jgi:hypothetical protein
VITWRAFVVIIGGGALGLSLNLRAQGQATPRRIGLLAASARAGAEDFLGLLQPELQELGWTEGRNLKLLEPRAVAGDFARLPSEARELVAQGSDLSLVQSVPATRALMPATKSIPIVMIGVGTPVEPGIVAGFVTPGGNVTGFEAGDAGADMGEDQVGPAVRRGQAVAGGHVDTQQERPWKIPWCLTIQWLSSETSKLSKIFTDCWPQSASNFTTF